MHRETDIARPQNLNQSIGRNIDKTLWFLICFGFLFISVAALPHFADNFTPTKWIALYIIVCILLASLVICPSLLIFPRFNNRFCLIIGLLSAGYIFSIGINFPVHYVRSLLDWVSFVVIAGMTFSILQRQHGSLLTLLNFNLISTLVVIGYGYLQLFHVEIFPSLTKNAFPSSLFGFQNHTAEFVGISILTQLAQIPLRQTNRKIRSFLHDVVLSLTFTYLFYLHARGASVALLLGGLVIIVRHLLLIYRSIVRVALLTMALFLVVHQSIPEVKRISIQDASSPAIKAGNIDIRLTRWMNSLYMVQSHPAGVGPGNYEFGYVEFHDRYRRDPESNEAMVVKDPHNSLLGIACEYGVISALCFLVGFFYFIRKILSHNLEASHDKVLGSLVGSILLFIFVDSLFAFPMGLAFPFYVAAIMVGIGCHLVTLRLDRTTQPRSQVGFGVVFFLYLLASSSFAYSNYLDFNQPYSYSSVATACRIFPENWRACLRQADIEMVNNRMSKAESTLNEILVSRPHHFPALGRLIKVELALGKTHDACKHLKIFLKYLPETKLQEHLTACQ